MAEKMVINNDDVPLVDRDKSSLRLFARRG
jgi:hypothetical protein